MKRLQRSNLRLTHLVSLFFLVFLMLIVPGGRHPVRAALPLDPHVQSTGSISGHVYESDPITVVGSGTTSGIDFTLDPANTVIGQVTTEEGDAVIQGHVYVKDGGPVSGIRIEADRWGGGEGWTYAFTDGSGAYTLSVFEGNWIVVIDRWDPLADGYTMEAMSLVAVNSGETINDVDVTLRVNDAVVVGVVQERDGTPIPNAKVCLRDGITGWCLGREVDADATGTYTLPVPAGTWHINAWHEDYLSPPSQQIAVSTGQTLDKDLYLSALNARILGQVLDQNDDPVPGAWVWGWHPKHEEGNGVSADASGTYTLPVYAGSWHIHAEHPPNYTNVPDRVVVVIDGQHLSGIDLRLNKATAVVQGMVHLGSYDGPPIDRPANVHANSSERVEWIHRNTIENTGIYTLGVTAGPWDAYVHLEGYTCMESKEFTVNDGDTAVGHLVHLTNTAIINGSITDQHGFPVPNADVSIHDPVSGLWVIPWHLGWADSGGQYTVGIAPGKWRICAWRQGYDTPYCPEITIADKETHTIDLVLESRTSTIDGIVTDLNPNPADNVPLEGASVQLWDQYGIAPVSDSSGPLMRDTTDAEGRFDFSLDIASGPYLVRAFKAGYAYGQGLIYALGGRHSAGAIRLSSEAGGTLSGQVTDGSSSVPNAVVAVRLDGSQSSAFTQDGALARTTTDVTGHYVFDVPFAPGNYTIVASAIGYDEATRAATITAGSDTVADLVLASTPVPSYGIAYLTSNKLTTIEANREYPALVQAHNVGAETWLSSGGDLVKFYCKWHNSEGQVVHSGTLAQLPYDISPDDVVFFPVSFRSPGEGEYTLEWGLWQSGTWLGETQAFSVTATAPILPNLYVQRPDISTHPPTVREGNTFDVLISVHNDSDADARNVTVDVFAGGNLFGVGRYILPLVPQRSTVVLRAVGYTPLSESVRTIAVRVDADNLITESDEGDNNATNTIQIHPPSSDPIAPSGTIVVNNGALTVDSTLVNLTLSAQDNPGGTGVQHMYVTEFVFDAAAGQWQIAQESGWISYTTDLAWTLVPAGGVKHFQVRFADKVWNISDAALAWINYAPPCDGIALAEWKLYQWPLTQGNEMTATVTPCGGQGDSDLYVWIGPSGGSPHYYSTNAGVAPDAVTLIAPETGEYNFWVYGFEETTYNLTMDSSVGGLGVATQGEGTRILAETKSLPEAPPSTIEPPTYVPATPLYKVVLILIHKNYSP